ncbi:MAG: hypothetical protein NXY57DRAFT_1000988, partial [Lentinula lateritia]
MITMDLTMACLCALLHHLLYPQTLIRYLTSLALDSVTNNLSSIPFYPVFSCSDCVRTNAKQRSQTSQLTAATRYLLKPQM